MSKSASWLLPKLYTLIYYKFIINYKWYILFPIHNLELVWLTYYLVSHLVIIQNGVVIQITTGFKFLYDQFLAVGSDAGWDILNKVCLTERQELEWVNVRLRAVCSTLLCLLLPVSVLSISIAFTHRPRTCIHCPALHALESIPTSI